LLENMGDREQWFKDRIGKRVWRNKTSCKCDTCTRVHEEGLVLSDEYHAIYVCDMEGCSNADDTPLNYFDTKKEARKFEKTLK